MEFGTVLHWGREEFIEKKSRFIGTCAPVETEEEALAFIRQVKEDYPDASHNVSAYLLREGDRQRFFDDGEPQGTAGIPLLEAMKKAGITNVAVVATRYFGGILLGGGGLIRAYSHTATIAMVAAEKILMRECLLLSFSCDYSLYGKVGSLVPECGGTVDDTAFLQEVTLSFHLPPEALPALSRKLLDASNGACVIQEQGKQFYPMPMP